MLNSSEVTENMYHNMINERELYREFYAMVKPGK
jgi:hypothetical protein